MGKNIMDIEEFLKKSSTISVKHMPDSSKYKAKKFSSWKEFWEDAKKGEMTFPTHRTKCECCGEITNPEDFVGAHIVNVHNSREMYIYPLCNSCNSTYGEGKKESPTFDVHKDMCVVFKVSDADIIEK